MEGNQKYTPLIQSITTPGCDNCTWDYAPSQKATVQSNPQAVAVKKNGHWQPKCHGSNSNPNSKTVENNDSDSGGITCKCCILKCGGRNKTT